MPYKDLQDLPDAVTQHLPQHAQEIFLAAFNHAEAEYKEEERAFKVARSAVKHQYEKGEDGNWHTRA
ncbi:MAG TPA: ChaB family protein [Allocoleopsis sp.]